MSEGFVVNQNLLISGGGQMGSLIRSKDWKKTSLGEINQWPQSLITTLNILLSSKFPMFLWWGKDLICFYNDSYRPSLGNEGKHPTILGQPAIQAWPEIWDTIEPYINQVLNGGESVWMEDQLIPIFRNGDIENVYWTFSYSAVKNEEGKNAGVLVVCTETTAKFLGVSKLAESEKKFRNLVNEAIVSTSILTGKDFVIELANDEALRLWGKDKTIIGKKLVEAIPELTGQPYIKILEDVFTTGVTYEGKENIALLNVDGVLKPVYTNFIYKALVDANKNIYGILVMGYDFTEHVLAEKRIAEAEERLRLAVDAGLLGTFDVNLITDEIVCSRRFCEIFGFPDTQPTHKQFVDAVHADDLYIRNEANKDSMQTGRISYEVRVVWQDKSVHWIDVQGKISFDENKKPVILIGTIKDISEQKNSLAVLEESEKKFRMLADSMPQFIWTGDKDGNLNYFNQAVYNYSGLTPDQINAGGWLQIVHPDDREENAVQWIHSVKTGDPFLFEHRFKKYSGEYRWQLSRAIPQKDENGNLQMWVGTSTDIDDIKKHDQQKDDFIKMASHELKTPVTTIKGYIQLLLKKHANGNDHFLSSSLITIDRQVSKLTKLVTDLLDVTKIETGSLQFAKETFNLTEKVKEIIKDIDATTQTHAIILHQHTEAFINADKNRIEQVVINLLTNAIKYSPKANEVIVEIKRSENNRVIVSVKDFGIGINAADHQKVFERFYRVSGKDEKTFPGFGIGLFIVHEIIQLHEGKIWVESEKDKGSVFYFSLPLSDKY